MDIAPFGGRCCVFATPIAQAASKNGVCSLQGCERDYGNQLWATQLSNSTTDLVATVDLVLALQRRRARLARPPNARYRCTNYGLGFRLSENPPQFTVPAELVARSRPAGHSVPIVRARQKLRRSHPYRLGVAALLLTLVLVLGMVGGVYYVLEAGSAAGYHLVCTTVGAPGSKTAHVDCHWEQLGTSR